MGIRPNFFPWVFSFLANFKVFPGEKIMLANAFLKTKMDLPPTYSLRKIFLDPRNSSNEDSPKNEGPFLWIFLEIIHTRAWYGLEVSSTGYGLMLNPIDTCCGPEREGIIGIQGSPGSGRGSDFSDFSDTFFRWYMTDLKSCSHGGAWRNTSM